MITNGLFFCQKIIDKMFGNVKNSSYVSFVIERDMKLNIIDVIWFGLRILKLLGY